MGLNFTMNMNMEGWIRLSVSKKRPKKLISRHKGCQLLVIDLVHCGPNSVLKVRFFGTLCIMLLLDLVCNILISYAAFLKLPMLEVSNTKGNQVSH